MKSWSENTCAWFGGLLLAGSVALRSLAAEPQPGDLPAGDLPPNGAARQPATGGLDVPAATLGYALGLRIGSRIAADFKGQEPAVDVAALARGLSDAILETAPRLSDQQIQEGLNTPVFFTKPFLTINTPEGARGVFFFRYDDLQKALSQVSDGQKLEPQAADLTAALREIIKAKDDVFMFFPTPEFFALVQEQQKQQQKGGAAAKPAANKP